MRHKERPPWCGWCDPTSRLVDTAAGAAQRCPRCHAGTQPGGRYAPKPLAGSPRLDAMTRES